MVSCHTRLDDLFGSLLPYFCILRMFSNVTCYDRSSFILVLSREGEQYLEENRQGPWARDMRKRMNEVSEADKQSV
jgi:hypothetical protein